MVRKSEPNLKRKQKKSSWYGIQLLYCRHWWSEKLFKLRNSRQESVWKRKYVSYHYKNDVPEKLPIRSRGENSLVTFKSDLDTFLKRMVWHHMTTTTNSKDLHSRSVFEVVLWRHQDLQCRKKPTYPLRGLTMYVSGKGTLASFRVLESFSMVHFAKDIA